MPWWLAGMPPPKQTKVKGKCAGVPSIYILQPVIALGSFVIIMFYRLQTVPEVVHDKIGTVLQL